MATWVAGQCHCHCHARACGFSNQLHPHPAFLPTFDYQSNVLPRWRRLSPPTLSFKNPLQKPTGDVTDTTSMFFYSLWKNNHMPFWRLILKEEICRPWKVCRLRIPVCLQKNKLQLFHRHNIENNMDNCVCGCLVYLFTETKLLDIWVILTSIYVRTSEWSSSYRYF